MSERKRSKGDRSKGGNCQKVLEVKKCGIVLGSDRNDMCDRVGAVWCGCTYTYGEESN